MPNKTMDKIKYRKGTQRKAAEAGRAAAQARGAKPKAKPKPKAKAKAKPKVKKPAVRNRAPTQAQKVPSISGGTRSRMKKIRDLEAQIRALEGK